jgi:hypothetical protein
MVHSGHHGSGISITSRIKTDVKMGKVMVLIGKVMGNVVEHILLNELVSIRGELLLFEVGTNHLVKLINKLSRASLLSRKIW